MTLPSSPLTDSHNLTANRRGALTDGQRQWLRSVNSRVNFLVYGFVLAIVLFMGVSFLPTIAEAPAEVWISLSIFLVVGIVAVALPGFKGLLDLYRLNRELAEARVEQADGRIEWKGNAYRAEVEGRTLRTPFGFTLEPGDYTFFYLPQTRWLVGAERRALQTAGAPDLQRILARTLRCDPDSLEANRRGELSDSQRRYLTFVAAANFFAAVVALGLAALLGAAALTEDNFIGGLILFALPVFLCGFFFLRGFNLARDLSAAVRAAEGRGRRSYSGGSRSMTYYWHIGSERFTVSASAYMAFVEGPRYRVYYTAKARRIVNVEVVQ